MGLLWWVTLAQGLSTGFIEAVLSSFRCFPPNLPSLSSLQQTVQEVIKRLRVVGMLEALYYVRPKDPRPQDMSYERAHRTKPFTKPSKRTGEMGTSIMKGQGWWKGSWLLTGLVTILRDHRGQSPGGHNYLRKRQDWRAVHGLHQKEFVEVVNGVSFAPRGKIGRQLLTRVLLSIYNGQAHFR